MNLISSPRLPAYSWWCSYTKERGRSMFAAHQLRVRRATMHPRLPNLIGRIRYCQMLKRNTYHAARGIPSAARYWPLLRLPVVRTSSQQQQSQRHLPSASHPAPPQAWTPALKPHEDYTKNGLARIRQNSAGIRKCAPPPALSQRFLSGCRPSLLAYPVPCNSSAIQPTNRNGPRFNDAVRSLGEAGYHRGRIAPR
jgi:hypothetical protein